MLRSAHRIRGAYAPGWPLHRFLIADDSMRPTLLPGDRLLALAPAWGRPLRVGDVVVVRDPEARVAYLVKRLAALDAKAGCWLLGDSRVASRDSRAFGLVPTRLVVGRIIWRYLPGQRRGRLAPPVQVDEAPR